MSKIAILSHEEVGAELAVLGEWADARGHEVTRYFREQQWDAKDLLAADLVVILGSLNSVSTGYEHPSSPQEIEEGMVLKAENALRGMQGIEQINSTSKENGAIIYIEGKKGFDTDELLSNVKNTIDKINEESFRLFLYQPNLPDVDLMIRTGGNCRVSNFLLWQLAYSELYFSPILWPEFSKSDLQIIIQQFQQQNRTYGRRISS